jgi:hypothetical protein
LHPWVELGRSWNVHAIVSFDVSALAFHAVPAAE